jgi:hypothetical protein
MREEEEEIDDDDEEEEMVGRRGVDRRGAHAAEHDDPRGAHEQ